MTEDVGYATTKSKLAKRLDTIAMSGTGTVVEAVTLP